ncbi:hypothetical protein D1165_12380 [Muribaculaceae bacterium M3]|nr:hypothetical protein [Muribaculaceae bacterium M3]
MISGYRLFADGGGLREPWASCSPPQWGGGELRGSKNRNNSHASAKPAAGTFSISRVQSRTCSSSAEARK